jgi:glutamate--cysteine ligase
LSVLPLDISMDGSALRKDLREHAFTAHRAAPGADRIGAEVEFLVLDSSSGAPVAIDAPTGPTLLPSIRRHALARRWVEEPTGYGAPRFLVRGGGCIFFEPGGQVEFSTPPLPSPRALLRCLRRVMLPLLDDLRADGIDPVFLGIDPLNPLSALPLQLDGHRYGRMAEHLARYGPAGGRMMRQTAALQLNLDFGEDACLRWRVLNAAAPYLLAVFASSPRYERRDTGHRSFRAACWRVLDPSRTGLMGGEADVEAEYLDFALSAEAMLMPAVDGRPLPFRDWVARGGVELADWRAHLSTLFPEVRPKGYLELRSLDAVGPEAWAAAVVLVSGLVCDRGTLLTAQDLLGAPDPAVLRTAGESGLSDPAIGVVARDLCGIALRAAAGRSGFDPVDLEHAADFVGRLTLRGLDPGHAAFPVTDAAAAFGG